VFLFLIGSHVRSAAQGTDKTSTPHVNHHQCCEVDRQSRSPSVNTTRGSSLAAQSLHLTMIQCYSYTGSHLSWSMIVSFSIPHVFPPSSILMWPSSRLDAPWCIMRFVAYVV